MLQPIYARPFFRVLEFPLGMAIIAGGLILATLIPDLVRGDLAFVGLAVLSVPLIVIGVLAIIHSITGSLPEWVVGTDDDDDTTHHSPAA
jgi:hypothetical protein